MNDNPPTQHIAETMLNEYLDGRLDRERHALIERHLAACAACRAEAAELQQVFSRLAALPEVPLSRDLSAQFMAGLPPAGYVRWPAWVRLVLAGQVVLALTLAVWLWPQIAPGGAALADAGRALGASFAAGLQSRFALLSLATDVFPAGDLSFLPSLAGSSAVLPVAQLAFLAGLALVAWLLGNALLLRTRGIPGK